MTTNGDIIRSEKVDIIKLALLNESDMIFSNIAFALRLDSNLISCSQLKEARISYHNHLVSMILKKAGDIISSI